MTKIKLNKKFLKKYLNTCSPSGFEVQMGGQKTWIKQIEKYADNVYLDNYGSAIAEMGNLESEYVVMIEAHADEIAWYVHSIDARGYLKVIRNGGSDTQIAPSMRVDVWAKNGLVQGVFGHPAIHVKGRAKESTLDTLFVDVGARNKKAAEKMGIEVGTVITFQAEFMTLGKDYFTAKALDNKIGGFAIAEVARLIKENDIELPYKLCIVNAVQEEIGLRGAGMVAKQLEPDIAFIVDVCHETTSPAYNAAKQGLFEAGQGGVLTIAPAVQNNLLNMVREICDGKDIPYQLAVTSNHTGTDTDAIAYAGVGTPSVLMSFPLKYMHTTVETVHKEDVKSVIASMYEFLRELDEHQEFHYKIS
jgi:putative aminopeptidase FrvX